MSAAMLERDEDVMDVGDDMSYSPFGSQQQPRISLGHLMPSADAGSGGSLFPLMLRPIALAAHGLASQLDRSNTQLAPAAVGQGPWLHHHPERAAGRSAHVSCGEHPSASPHHHGQHHPHDDAQHDPQQPSHSLQHLLAVGSRQWGNGGWWDGRGLLRVKIYDFAIYADADKALSSLRAAASAGRVLWLPRGAGGGGGGGGGGGSSSRPSPVDLLVPSSSGVDMSLTIRACRNLPLPLLSQEFERILARRVAKAGGRPDDPALRELLSYFSRARLPPHIVTPAGAGAGQDEDAVRKGAAITFSRRSGGELVTEAGGCVLGSVVAPELAEALFDLYLGDQPVSSRAKAAAGDALLRLADGGLAPARYRYRLQPGERLRCAPGAGPEACLLELP